MKHMTEVAAWRYLAKRWDAAVTRTGSEAVFGYGRHFGICSCVTFLGIEDKINGLCHQTMRERMDTHRPKRKRNREYWWPWTAAGAKKRAAFCRKMAELAKAERKVTHA